MSAGDFTVAIRADAGRAIGGGHVIRCLALAEAFACHGAKPLFFSHPDSVAAAPALGRSGWPVSPIRFAEGPIAYASGVADQRRFDVLVVDHYAIGDRHERVLARSARLLMVIDDLPDRLHACDLLVDLRDNARAPEEAWRAPGAEILTGLGFALLRPEFAERRASALTRHVAGGKVGRVLVSLGLTDPSGATLDVVKSLIPLIADYSLDVVVGPQAHGLASLAEIAAAFSRVRLHVDPPNIAHLMAQADLAVGAGGIASWERCCLGLPSIVLQLADNQAANIATLTRSGAAVLGTLDGVSSIADQLATLAFDVERRSGMARYAADLCDGKGAQRVAHAAMEMLEKKAA